MQVEVGFFAGWRRVRDGIAMVGRVRVFGELWYEYSINTRSTRRADEPLGGGIFV